MIGISVKTNLDGTVKKLRGRAEDTTRVLEMAVISSCEPYVPYDTGRLCSSAHSSGSGEFGEVTYDTEYAAACYYAAREFGRKKHPMATARWFEAAKTADLDKWMETAKLCLMGASLSRSGSDLSSVIDIY